MMDTLMDKLAQKLTAQEMIKANQAADAEELKRIQNQVAQYETLLKRMQEYSEKHAASIDQMERVLSSDSESAKVLQEKLDEMRSAEGVLFAQTCEHVHKEDVKVYRNVQAVVVEECAKLGEAITKVDRIVKGKMNAVLGISIAALVTAVGGLIFQILTYFHII